MQIQQKIIDHQNSLNWFKRNDVNLRDFGTVNNGVFTVNEKHEQEFVQIMRDFKLSKNEVSRRNNVKYLELIVTCVNYSDYLRLTLLHNKIHFDNIVIVTDISDYDTQEVCKDYDVSCVITDVFFRNSAAFNKGAGINVGFNHLNKTDQILHLDADIILPFNFREMLNIQLLNYSYMYGCGRVVVNDPRNYINWMVVFDMSYVHRNTEQAVRKGYGYFQLFSMKYNKNISYYEHSSSAAVSDMVFAKNWKYYELHELSDSYCIHIGETYINQKGRITESIKGYFEKDVNLPKFVVIGAMRSGTTFVHMNLLKSKNVYLPPFKETDFFSRRFNDSGYMQYNDIYKVSKDFITGEASPNYTSFVINRDTPQNIKKILPDVKLIYLLRDPIDRIVSSFNLFHKRGVDTLMDINDMFNYDNGFLYIDRSLYHQHLLNYLKWFDMKNILLVDFNDLISSPETEMKNIANFVGAEYNMIDTDQKVNHIELDGSVVNKLTDASLNRLKDALYKEMEALRKLTGMKFSKQKV